MKQITFVVSPSADGGFTAKALGNSLLTEGDTEEELRELIRDTVRTHFEDSSIPRTIRLRYQGEVVIEVNE